jgi:hypothetical protein
MGYFEKIDWDRIKRDLQEGVEKGAVALKQGALVVKRKAGELSDEGQRQYKLMAFKSRVHSAMFDLGTRVYAVLGSRKKNPTLDARVKDLVVQIKKMETQISALERPGRTPRGKRRTTKTAR